VAIVLSCEVFKGIKAFVESCGMGCCEVVTMLEAIKLNEVIKGAKKNGQNLKVKENLKVEKKKKKVVLGKGTSLILALFKERLHS